MKDWPVGSPAYSAALRINHGPQARNATLAATSKSRRIAGRFTALVRCWRTQRQNQSAASGTKASTYGLLANSRPVAPPKATARPRERGPTWHHRHADTKAAAARIAKASSFTYAPTKVICGQSPTQNPATNDASGRVGHAARAAKNTRSDASAIQSVFANRAMADDAPPKSLQIQPFSAYGNCGTKM